jgi:heme oxygenase
MITLELTTEEFQLVRLAIARMLGDLTPAQILAATTLIQKFVIELKKSKGPHH